jgi:hypothetical protein
MATARVAELEARRAAKDQELRETKARYDELRHRIIFLHSAAHAWREAPITYSLNLNFDLCKTISY